LRILGSIHLDVRYRVLSNCAGGRLSSSAATILARASTDVVLTVKSVFVPLPISGVTLSSLLDGPAPSSEGVGSAKSTNNEMLAMARNAIKNDKASKLETARRDPLMA
jgi:hypothetical protein